MNCLCMKSSRSLVNIRDMSRIGARLFPVRPLFLAWRALCAGAHRTRNENRETWLTWRRERASAGVSTINDRRYLTWNICGLFAATTTFRLLIGASGRAGTDGLGSLVC